jgi:hypothetical protein
VGKSTLASYFLGKGFRLVTDDLLRVTFQNQTVIAHPGPQRIKLLPECAAKFMPEATCTHTVNPFTTKKLIVPAAGQKVSRGVPLASLYLLDSSDRIDDINLVRAERLRSGEATLTVITSTFNVAVKTPKRLTRQLHFAGQVLSKIPILRLSYPRQFDALSLVYELVVRGLVNEKI